MAYVTVTSDVDTDDFIDDIDTDDLIDELKRRGLNMNTQYVDGDEMRMLLTKIWEKRRLNQDFSQELDQMIYKGLGKVL
jgi:hypothetical protein